MTTILGISLENYIILIIIAIPIYFIFHWSLIKIIKDTKTRTITSWVSTILLTPIIYFGTMWLFIAYMFYYPNRAFDRKKWLKDNEKRYELSKDLIENQLLIGKSKLQVKEILGLDSNCEENDIWIFYLGFTPGLGIDPDVLKITFKNGKVIEVEQYEG